MLSPTATSRTTETPNNNDNSSSSNRTSITTLAKDVRRHNLLVFIVLVFGVMIMLSNQKLVALPSSSVGSSHSAGLMSAAALSSTTGDDEDIKRCCDSSSTTTKDNETTATATTFNEQQVDATAAAVEAPSSPPLTISSKMKRKRWAVMMMGGARTYAFTRQSFLENIVKQTDSQVDIFTYSFFRQELSKNDVTNFTNNNNNPTSSGSCHIDDMSLQLLSVDSAVLHIDNNFVKFDSRDQKGMTRDRFSRQQIEHLEIIESYSKENNVTYDYLLITRPDLYFSLPLDMKQLEQELDDRVNRNDNSTVFNPTCCKFKSMPDGGGKGWCDRFTASTYHDFSRMIKGTNDWYKVARQSVRGGVSR